jgi:hypothetical protein
MRQKLGISALAAGMILVAPGATGSALADHEAVGPPVSNGPLQPTNQRPPVISGTAQDAQTLTADRGDWSSGPGLTLSHRWIRCDPDGVSACFYLHADDQPTYTLTSAEVGKTIKLRVRADSTGGTREVDSPTTPVVEAAPPSVSVPPSFSGSPVVGATLTGTSGSFSGGTPPVVEDQHQWYRCAGTDLAGCAPIPNATSLNYTVTADDVGSRLVLQERATYGPSSQTVDGWSSTSPEVTFPSAVPAPTLLDPFPVVAIAGVVRRNAARLALLRVRGPRGALVAVRCFGRACRPRSIRRRIGLSGRVRIRAFERRMPAGTAIIIRVSAPNRIGKYTRFRIRRGARPRRIDRCLQPGATQPSRCPSE